MKRSKINLAYALVSLVLVSSASVAAVTTQHFKLDRADAFFGGELEGTAVHSNGTVRVGAAVERREIKDVPIAYSVAKRGDDVYVGTGTNGVIYHFQNKKLKKKYATRELLVASLAFGPNGVLYAGTVPNGRVFKINPRTEKITRFATPKGAKHIWALTFDKRRGRLIAGTGPEGEILAINSEGVSKVLYKGEAAHVMSLSGNDRGTIYGGTSDSALVIAIAPDGNVSVVNDFPGNEVTAIDFYDGQLAVVANEFKTKPGAQFKAPAPAPTARPSARPRPGKGQLWRIGKDGRIEKLVDSKEAHFASVQWGSDGAIYAGSGAKGHILRVEPDASYSIWADVDERQVLGLSLRGETPAFVTGDGAAVYWVEAGVPAKPVWTSKTLDTGFGSQWGRLTWRGTGKLVFQTRTGNTTEPDDTWSDWSRKLKEPSKVTSPAGRFAQIRATFPSDREAVLRAVELYYLPQNQRARISAIQGRPPPPKPVKPGTPKPRPAPPSPLVNLTWQVVNPDRDDLRFRLSFRREGQSVWRPMFLEDQVLTEPKYTWNTSSIPDGYYVVRVEVSDEEANPQNLTLRSRSFSEPMLIDNHPPTIEKLRFRNGVVSGVATDSLGPIARLQASIDSGPWRDIFPKDLLLDSRQEAFEMKLKSGSHIVAIRASDAAGNQATDEIVTK